METLLLKRESGVLTPNRPEVRNAMSLGMVLELHGVHARHAACALDRALAEPLHEMLQCAPGAVAATKALMPQ